MGSERALEEIFSDGTMSTCSVCTKEYLNKVSNLLIYLAILPSIHQSIRLTFTNLLLPFFFLIRIGLPPLAFIIGLLCCFL